MFKGIKNPDKLSAYLGKLNQNFKHEKNLHEDSN